MPARATTSADHAARARLKRELGISRDMLAEAASVVPRFVLELPHVQRVVILTNLPGSGGKRESALRLIAGILAYKTALSFVLAFETLAPDTINAVLVAPGVQLGAMQSFDRHTLKFGEVVFFDPRHTDHDIVELLPKGRVEITTEDEVEIRDFLDRHEAWPNIYMLEI